MDTLKCITRPNSHVTSFHVKYQKSWSTPPTKPNHIYCQPLKDLYCRSHCWLYSRYISRPFIQNNSIARHVKQNIKPEGHKHLFSLWGMPFCFPCYQIQNYRSSMTIGRKVIILQFFFFQRDLAGKKNRIEIKLQ